jgi:hypothetical protein
MVHDASEVHRCLSMSFADLASPAEASNETAKGWRGFAQAGNRHHPRIKSEDRFFWGSYFSGRPFR